MGEVQYHLSIGGRQFQGLTAADIRERLAADPTATRSALVWTEGWPDWAPAVAVFPSEGPRSLLRRGVELVPGFLASTDRGDTFRMAGALLLRTAGVLAGLIGLFWWVAIWLAVVEAPGRVIVAAVLPQLVLAVACLFVVQVFWYRAAQVAALPDGPAPATRAIAWILRAAGDAGLLAWATIGIGTLLFVVIAGGEAHLIDAYTMTPTFAPVGFTSALVAVGLGVAATLIVAVLLWLVAHLFADLLTAFVATREATVVLDDDTP